MRDLPFSWKKKKKKKNFPQKTGKDGRTPKGRMTPSVAHWPEGRAPAFPLSWSVLQDHRHCLIPSPPPSSLPGTLGPLFASQPFPWECWSSVPPAQSTG